MSDHAKLAPSAAHRWMECPGSVALCAGIPDDESVYAAEGTFAHAIAATCLQLDAEPRDFLGTTSSCGRFVIDKAFVEHLRVYVEAVRGTVELEGGDLEIEQRVQVAPELWGTADALIWNGSDLHVFDLKFGGGVFVPVEDNKQALCYALGALLSRQRRARAVRRVYLHIVQPRHFGQHRKWRTQVLERRGLETWHALSVVPKIEATKKDDAPLVPGDSQCRFCPAKAICPELRRTALQNTRHLFADAERRERANPPPDPKSLTPQQVVTALRTFDLIESWMAAVRQHAYELAERKRIPLPGYKLVRKTGHRRWKDPTAAAAKLRALGVDPDETPKLISPAEAERRLGKRKEVVQELAYVPELGTALVPESDKRPAWVPGAAFSPQLSDEKGSNNDRRVE